MPETRKARQDASYTLVTRPFPEKPWLKLGMVIVGPFERTRYDCRYAITLLDYYSKTAKVHFCRETTTSTVIRFFVSVITREGYPEETICDNGPQFATREFEAFLQASFK